MRTREARWLYQEGLLSRLNRMGRVRGAVRHQGEVLDREVRGHLLLREGRCAPWKVAVGTLRATSAVDAALIFVHHARRGAR